MTIRINEYVELTTEHPASHYGIPVLVTDEGKAYGPSQATYPEKFKSVFGDMRAAHSVYSYAISNKLDEETRKFVQLYLGQWPEGPQLENVTSDAAVILGRKGGSVKSERKAKASAENGKLGGRPRKITNVEIAKEVCKAIPEADFEKVLKNIDIGRNQQDEAKFARKDIMQSYIDGFKESYEK